MTVTNDIDNYLADQPAEIKNVLEELRTTIKQAAPEAQEALIYSLPAFKYKGHLVGFAVQKNHGSLGSHGVDSIYGVKQGNACNHASQARDGETGYQPP